MLVGSGVVTSLLVSTLGCVQHHTGGIYSGHPRVPLGPHSYLLDFEGGPQSEDQCGGVAAAACCLVCRGEAMGGPRGHPLVWQHVTQGPGSCSVTGQEHMCAPGHGWPDGEVTGSPRASPTLGRGPEFLVNPAVWGHPIMKACGCLCPL